MAWRPLLREGLTYLLVGGFVALVLVGVWWTRHPGSASLTAARDWPLVGPVAAKLQDLYLPAPPAPTAEVLPSGTIYRRQDGETSRTPFDYIYELREPRPYIWVAQGASLRREPSFDSETLHQMEAMTNLFIEERRGDWVRVRHQGRDAWVVDPRGGSDEDHGDRPAPVLPLPGVAPDAELLERAFSAMSLGRESFEVGGYMGWSDVDPGVVIEGCREPIERLDELFRRELGVEPVGEPAETLLIFGSRASYEAFADRSSVEGSGQAGPGYAATWIGARRPEEVCATLIHEAAHLTSRRSIGPALPLWLGEGIAEYAKWSLSPGERPPFGPWKAAERALPGLESMVTFDAAALGTSPSGPEWYAASGFWVTYLLEEPDLAPGFRSFLAYLASGGPWAEGIEGSERVPEPVRITPTLGDDLVHHLGRDYTRLDAGMRVWLWSRG